VVGRFLYYLLDQGVITSNPTLHTTLTYLYAAVQFLLPAAILSFCTTRLVQALRESGRIQRRYWTVVRNRSSTEPIQYWTDPVLNRSSTGPIQFFVENYVNGDVLN